jgi:hypothetical protein
MTEAVWSCGEHCHTTSREIHTATAQDLLIINFILFEMELSRKCVDEYDFGVATHNAVVTAQIVKT